MLFTAQKLDTEQLSLFLGANFVVTFQEQPGDCFSPIRERIRKNHTRIRCTGPDYLAYAILDAVVDNYFPALERYGEQLEELEQEVVTRPGRQTLGRIHDLKRDLLTLRRAVWPAREALNSLVRDESPFVARDTRTYLRDCYDHAVRVIDIIETDRETAFGLLETYLSSMSNRMNEIMKVLTIIATIFIPLTFIVGIYGMNFTYMPELHSPWGYPAVMHSWVSSPPACCTTSTAKAGCKFGIAAPHQAFWKAVTAMPRFCRTEISILRNRTPSTMYPIAAITIITAKT